MSPIPWGAILRHGPTLVAAASRLVAREDARRHPGGESSEARLGSLEKTSLESARLLQDIAQQVQALTIAQEQTARRARLALVLGIAGLVLAIAAGVLATLR